MSSKDLLELVENGSVEEFEECLKRTSNVKAKLKTQRKSDGLTAACIFVRRQGAPEGFLDALVRAGACFRTPCKTDVTPLILLTMEVGEDEEEAEDDGYGEEGADGLGERTSLLKQLLDLDAAGTVNLGIEATEAGDKLTALHYAAMSSNEEAVVLLVNAMVSKGLGLDPRTSQSVSADSFLRTVNLVDGSETPLHFAARFCASKACNALLDGGSDPTLKNGAGLTAAHAAARSCQIDALTVLLPREESASAVEAMLSDTDKTHRLISASIDSFCARQKGNVVSAELSQWMQVTVEDQPLEKVREWRDQALQAVRMLEARAKQAHPSKLPQRQARYSLPPVERWDHKLAPDIASRHFRPRKISDRPHPRFKKQGEPSSEAPEAKRARMSCGMCWKTPCSCSNAGISSPAPTGGESPSAAVSSGGRRGSAFVKAGGDVEMSLRVDEEELGVGDVEGGCGEGGEAMSIEGQEGIAQEEGGVGGGGAMAPGETVEEMPEGGEGGSAAADRDDETAATGSGGGEAPESGEESEAPAEEGLEAPERGEGGNAPAEEGAEAPERGGERKAPAEEGGKAPERGNESEAPAEEGGGSDATENEIPLGGGGRDDDDSTSTSSIVSRSGDDDDSSSTSNIVSRSGDDDDSTSTSSILSRSGDDDDSSSTPSIVSRSGDDDDSSSTSSIVSRSSEEGEQGGPDPSPPGAANRTEDQESRANEAPTAAEAAKTVKKSKGKEAAGKQAAGAGASTDCGSDVIPDSTRNTPSPSQSDCPAQPVSPAGMQSTTNDALIGDSHAETAKACLQAPKLKAPKDSSDEAVGSGSKEPEGSAPPPAASEGPKKDIGQQVQGLVIDGDGPGLLELLLNLGERASEALNCFVGDNTAATVFARHAAPGGGFEDVLKYMKMASADFSKRRKGSETPLMLACGRTDESERIFAVGLILDRTKCAVRAGRADGWSALHIAASLGCLQTCKMLLDKSASIKARNNMGESAVHVAVTFCVRRETREFLLSKWEEKSWLGYQGLLDGARKAQEQLKSALGTLEEHTARLSTVDSDDKHDPASLLVDVLGRSETRSSLLERIREADSCVDSLLQVQATLPFPGSSEDQTAAGPSDKEAAEQKRGAGGPAAPKSRVSEGGAPSGPCNYEFCEMPEGKPGEKFVLIKAGRKTGERDWSSLVGQVLCDKCCQRYARIGTLVKFGFGNNRVKKRKSSEPQQQKPEESGPPEEAEPSKEEHSFRSCVLFVPPDDGRQQAQGTDDYMQQDEPSQDDEDLPAQGGSQQEKENEAQMETESEEKTEQVMGAPMEEDAQQGQKCDDPKQDDEGGGQQQKAGTEPKQSEKQDQPDLQQGYYQVWSFPVAPKGVGSLPGGCAGMMVPPGSPFPGNYTGMMVPPGSHFPGGFAAGMMVPSGPPFPCGSGAGFPIFGGAGPGFMFPRAGGADLSSGSTYGQGLPESGGHGMQGQSTAAEAPAKPMASSSVGNSSPDKQKVRDSEPEIVDEFGGGAVPLKSTSNGADASKQDKPGKGDASKDRADIDRMSTDDEGMAVDDEDTPPIVQVKGEKRDSIVSQSDNISSRGSKSSARIHEADGSNAPGGEKGTGGVLRKKCWDCKKSNHNGKGPPASRCRKTCRHTGPNWDEDPRQKTREALPIFSRTCFDCREEKIAKPRCRIEFGHAAPDWDEDPRRDDWTAAGPPSPPKSSGAGKDLKAKVEKVSSSDNKEEKVMKKCWDCKARSLNQYRGGYAYGTASPTATMCRDLWTHTAPDWDEDSRQTGREALAIFSRVCAQCKSLCKNKKNCRDVLSHTAPDWDEHPTGSSNFDEHEVSAASQAAGSSSCRGGSTSGASGLDKGRQEGGFVRPVPPRAQSPVNLPVAKPCSKEVAALVKQAHTHVRTLQVKSLKSLLRSPSSKVEKAEVLNNFSVEGRTALGVWAAEVQSAKSEDGEFTIGEMFETLLELGADPAARCSKGLTPMLLACQRLEQKGAQKKVQRDIVRLLLEEHDSGRDIGVDAREKVDYCTPLLLCLASGEHSRLASEELIKRRLNFESRCYPQDHPNSIWWNKATDGDTPLILSVRVEDLDSLGSLLDAGADVNQQNDEGMTAADVACLTGNFEALQALLKDPHLELSASTCFHMESLARNTASLIEKSIEFFKEHNELLPELVSRSMYHGWQPKDLNQVLEWKKSALQCKSKMGTLGASMRKEENALIVAAGGPNKVQRILTLNEACEPIGAVAMRESELSVDAHRTFSSLSQGKDKVKGKPAKERLSRLGTRKLPDHSIKDGREVPADKRSVKWTNISMDPEAVIDPVNGNMWVTKKRKEKVDPHTQQQVLEYLKYSSHSPLIRIGQVGPEHPAYLGADYPAYCLLAGERIYHGQTLCEYIGKIQTTAEMERAQADDRKLQQHEFTIAGSEGLHSDFPLVVSSNTQENQIPVRSHAMMINDPRKGLDDGTCDEVTHTEGDQLMSDLISTGRIAVHCVADLFGKPRPAGETENLFPIALGEEGDFVAMMKVIELDREKNEIVVCKESIKKHCAFKKQTGKGIRVPDGTPVVQFANAIFVEIETDGFPRVFVRTGATTIEKGEEILASYGESFWKVNQVQILQKRVREEQRRKEEAEERAEKLRQELEKRPREIIDVEELEREKKEALEANEKLQRQLAEYQKKDEERRKSFEELQRLQAAQFETFMARQVHE